MDKKTHKELYEIMRRLSKIRVGDKGVNVVGPSKQNMFLDTLFGKKRLLILKVNNKAKIIKELKRYCAENELEVCKLEAKNLRAYDIRGEREIIFHNGIPLSNRKKPHYISGNKQMIIVDNLNADTDIETLRAFMYMGSLGSFYDDVENLPKDKLPYGSAYVFIAEEEFPLKKFASISSYWRDEAAILDLRDFQTKVKGHLGAYKRNELKIKENGIFKFKNDEIPYEHILPKSQKELNIIEKYRANFFKSEYSKDMKLHKYFHHLNSSQAMCINFFYPLIKERLLESLLEILRIQGDINYNPEDICFEKESDIENTSQRRTNFDFYIKLNSGTKIYFEIKYTENEFGKAKNDDSHKSKFNNIYLQKLKDNPAIKDNVKSEDMFLNNYQIMRNLIHINEDSYVVFIYPEENESIRQAALSARREIIESGWEGHFILFKWEDLIEKLKSSLNSKELINYYTNDFIYKYLKY